MRKSILLLLLLSLPVLCFSDAGLIGEEGQTPSGSCSSTTDNIFDEGFEGAGYENTWSENGSGTINEDYSRPGAQSPTALCSQVLYVDTDSSNETYATLNEGTARSEVYVRFYYYPGTQAASTYPYILDAGDSNGVYNLGFRVQLYSGASPSVRARGATDSSTASVNAGAWNLIEIHFVRNDASWIKINGGSELSFTASDYDVQYYFLGHTGLAPTPTLTSYYDLFAINTVAIGGE